MDRIAPWLQTHWDDRAAGNFIGGGTGSGLAIVAATTLLASGEGPPAAFALAALLIALGLGLVWFEMGRPWRFLHVFLHPHTSWMTREALIAPPLLAALGIAAWLGGAASAVAALVLSLAFLYSQSQILHAAKGIPAWREPRIVPLIMTTGIAEGAGAYLLIGAVFGVLPESPFAIAFALAAIFARSFAWSSYRRHLSRSSAPAGARRALAAFSPMVVMLGTIVPFVLLLAALALPDAVNALAPLGGLAALAVGWRMKHGLLRRAAFNQGFAIAQPPGERSSTTRAEARPGWS
ncbi:MAG: phenylacetyl-CoA:acceptor oxidoreductase [Alphaproteobacteria bacterium]